MVTDFCFTAYRPAYEKSEARLNGKWRPAPPLPSGPWNIKRRGGQHKEKSDWHKTVTTLKHKVEGGNGAQASPPSHLAHGA